MRHLGALIELASTKYSWLRETLSFKWLRKKQLKILQVKSRIIWETSFPRSMGAELVPQGWWILLKMRQPRTIVTDPQTCHMIWLSLHLERTLEILMVDPLSSALEFIQSTRHIFQTMEGGSFIKVHGQQSRWVREIKSFVKIKFTFCSNFNQISMEFANSLESAKKSMNQSKES